MKYSTLKRLEKLENEEVIEIEDLSELYRDIFGEESEVLKKYEEIAEHTKKTCRTLEENRGSCLYC